MMKSISTPCIDLSLGCAVSSQRKPSMKNTASDFLIRRINEGGLKRIYGYPGDGINGIVGALDRADGAVEYVQVRHEEMAAFMAGAHAKFTGEVGICLATS